MTTRWESETSADLLPDAVTNPAYLKKGKAKAAKTETKGKEPIEKEAVVSESAAPEKDGDAGGQGNTVAEPDAEKEAEDEAEGEAEEGQLPAEGDGPRSE